VVVVALLDTIDNIETIVIFDVVLVLMRIVEVILVVVAVDAATEVVLFDVVLVLVCVVDKPALADVTFVVVLG